MDANLDLAKRPNRQSLRLHGYDYSSPGAYFVTIAAQNHECIFGNIENSELRLNDAGKWLFAGIKSWSTSSQESNVMRLSVCQTMSILFL